MKAFCLIRQAAITINLFVLCCPLLSKTLQCFEPVFETHHTIIFTGLGVWCFCGRWQPSGVDLHSLWLRQQWQSYKRGLLCLCSYDPFVCYYVRGQTRKLYCVFHLEPQDMSSLMHTIYDVVDASVNQSCHNKSKTLRVKLTVTPEPRCNKREMGAGKSQQEKAPNHRHNFVTPKYQPTKISVFHLIAHKSSIHLLPLIRGQVAGVAA